MLHVAGNLQRQPRLAASASTRERQHAGHRQQLLDLCDLLLAANEAGHLVRQVVSGLLVRRGAIDASNSRNKAIAVTGHGGDRVGSKHLAERGNVHLQGVFFDDHARPDPREHFVLGDEAPTAFDECDQQVEGVGTEAYRRSVSQQPTLLGLQFEATEPIADRRVCRSHDWGEEPGDAASSLVVRVNGHTRTSTRARHGALRLRPGECDNGQRLRSDRLVVVTGGHPGGKR